MRCVLLVAALLLALAAPAAAQELDAMTDDPASVFAGEGMWIWQLERTEGGDPAAIAAKAQRAGLSHVIVKAAHGVRWWPQFSTALTDALHAAGLRVCAYQRALARAPEREAAVLARATSHGADCLVIDAEVEYEGRHAAAARYVRALQARIGEETPVALTSFPLVSLHPAFPYRTFLQVADVNLPQVYWKLIGSPATTLLRTTFAQNAAFGRPVIPIGQLFDRPSPFEVGAFRRLSRQLGAPGVSWWVWQHAGPREWASLTPPLR